MKKITPFICAALLSTALSAETYTELGQRAYAKARYDTALSYFKKAIENGTEKGTAYFFAGSILEAERKYGESIRYFEAAIDRPLKSKFKKAALWKIILYYRRVKNYEKALPYVEQLEKAGVRHRTLEKVKAEAEVYLTPEKKEARVMIAKAAELEELLKENRKGEKAPVYYREHADVTAQIIGYLKKAYEKDNSLLKLHWKIAYYSEKTGNLEDARNSYMLLNNESGDLRALYKVGVIEKKLKNYETAVSHLKYVANKNTEKNRLAYYTDLNLAQSYLGAGIYDEALSYAGQVLKYKKSRKKYRMMARLIQCLAGLFSSEKSACRVGHESVKNNRLGSSIYNYYRGHRLRFKQADKKAVQAYRRALLQKNSGNSSDFSDDEDERGRPLPHWARVGWSEMLSYLAAQKQWALLDNLLKLYDEMPVEKNELLIRAGVDVYNNRLQSAESRFDRVYSYNLNEFKMYTEVLARNRRLLKLQGILKEYLKKKPEQKSQIAAFIADEKAFSELRKNEDFKAFLMKYGLLPGDNRAEENNNTENDSEPDERAED